ncbi:MAG: metal ABC transporter permease [Alphaproteobacteria bacterium]|nr:metal ABC transporter permease [Alphaproteobacteria bacterium]MCB9930554.1 metal ABC transporter permease [Alphaproteobacteria bacterium]
MSAGTITRRTGTTARTADPPFLRSRTSRPVFDTFFLYALAAGIGVALVAAPLGCFVVWRGLAFFGDALAHSALLGLAFGIALGIAPGIAVLSFAVVFALVLALLERWGRLASDTLLGILAPSLLAAGMVAASVLPGVRLDLVGALFGDVLAVGTADLAWIYGGGLIVLAALAWLWRPLIAATTDAELAAVEGVPIARLNLALLLLLALTVALAVKVVGVLLIGALLVIPAAAARTVARSPEAMAAIAAGIGATAVALGLLASFLWDAPAGPAIVLAATLLFAVSLAAGRQVQPA